MLKTGLYLVMITLLLVMALMLAGCGGGGGGEGALSSAATLGLTVNKTTVSSQTDTVTATVTLTSLNSQPVNGVSVTVDMTYNNVVVGSYSGNTNTNGVVAIVVPVALVPADRTVYLQARSSGVTSSSSLAVAVKAPVLATTLDTTYAGTIAAGIPFEVIFSGANASFKDYYGNAFSSEPNITFTYDSISGNSSGILYHNGTALNIGDSFTVTPDSNGEALLGLSAELTALAPSGTPVSSTFNYTLTVLYGGFTYTKQGSVNYTLTSS